MNIKTIAIAAFIVVFLTGCSQAQIKTVTDTVGTIVPVSKTASTQTKAGATCAVMGGVLGGAAGTIGGAIGAGKTGALIGGAVGTAVGAGVAGWFCYDKATEKNKDTFNYVDTQKRVNYNPKLGNKLKVEAIKMDSTEVEPGNEVKIDATYYVMTADKKNDVEITEEWAIDSQSNEPVKINMAQGTRDTSITIPIPEDAKKGKHTISLTIKYAAKTSKKSKKKPKLVTDKKVVEFTIV